MTNRRPGDGADGVPELFLESNWTEKVGRPVSETAAVQGGMVREGAQGEPPADAEYYYNMDDYYNVNMSNFRLDLLPAPMPDYIKTTLTLMFVLIIIAAVVGNLMVMLLVIKFPKLRTVTNVFLVSLAVSDTLIAAVNMPITLRLNLQTQWTMGEALCKIGPYLQGVVIIASIFTLVAIAIDRYYAICYPLRALHVHTLSRAGVIISVCWVLAFLLNSPQLFIQTTEQLLVNIIVNETSNQLVDVEYAYLCVEAYFHQWQPLVYSVFFYVILYLFPVVTMLITYTKIARILWRRRPIGETMADHPGETDRRVKQNRRVVRMLVVIVVLFALSWLPFFTCQIYLVFSPPHDQLNVNVIVAFVQVLGYSNSAINPMVYCFMNESFRQHLFKIICCRCYSRRFKKRRRSSPSFQPVVTSNAPTNVSML